MATTRKSGKQAVAGQIPFRKDMAFEYGEPTQVSPLVRRIVAPNPSAFTYRGTNTYIVGHGRVAIIDPGPLVDSHLDAICAAVADEEVSHILLTHTHLDHSQAAPALKSRLGGQSAAAVPAPIPEGEAPSESIHYDFAPERVLGDNDVIEGDGWTLSAVFTPGHMSNHMCFALAEEKILFTGDHVMGWNTTIVSPPDGNMKAYLNSLEVCLARDDKIYWPGHGPEIGQPRPFVRAYRAHRRMREREIENCIRNGVLTIPTMVRKMYRHLPETMHRAAARSVLAHLEHMIEAGRVVSDGAPAAEATYRLS